MQICVRNHVDVHPQKKKEVLYFVKKNVGEISIKSPTLILSADHSTLLFLPRFFLQNKELLFSSVGEHLHDHGHIFAWPSPF